MDHGHDNGNSIIKHCSMKMTFNTDYNNLCIVFKQWHISSGLQFGISLLVIVFLGYAFEKLRSYNSIEECCFQKAYNEQTNGLITPAKRSGKVSRPFRLCTLYAIQLIFSYFLMLVAMTYNAYVIAAIAIGAALGYRRSHCDSLQSVGLCH
ncbi:vacuolar copper transporter Ctr6 [Schizosaccharomyces cryophilus OY26]|uniref:Copper transport protein n=1 Tax=Schizosaccharomyces cryophilus (strain OY26 / ATCC MYA-4695 / CBS 11777 / NBRC 106824 / NRRL Y48691) TaxID=653667 RepID=S9VTV9_SCHCR|nr:vacuolar copper transporter Ctr6 [Schizosaccharomyces cryophilus OY26]EPY49609.1 vacuolar copper transporter Ctr6 [Schizosaccharomyces cryophilus OY26]